MMRKPHVASAAHGPAAGPNADAEASEGERRLMTIPQVADHLKRAPTMALRAVFGGVGRILMAADRPRAAAAPAAGGPASATGLAVLALPLPRYEELSLASIRARLRSLDARELRVLADYERTNAERPEVLGMLERRIEKLEAAECR
jgi:hypothetical protein